MKHYLTLAILLSTVACAPKEHVYKGVHEGVEISYRWAHPEGKPSELLLNLKNTSAEDKQLGLVLDLYFQGRTVESFEADTCIRSGQRLNGKLNGFYFNPQRLSTEQIKSGDSSVEITRSTIEGTICP